MRRFIRFDHLGNVVGEVSANDIISMHRLEEINGEHSLTITTIQVLGKNERIVYQDFRGIWREYVVVGVDEEHAVGKRIIGTYYCVWSIQVDLLGVPVSVMPGVQSSVSATLALQSALSSQTRWAKGTVTNTATGGASMYDTNAWDALSILVENWGGELGVTIEVASNSGVTARKVDYYTQQGEQTVKRRFDFGSDLKGVKRTFADEPFYCRVSPRGKGEETENGGYGRKITIESVNNNKDYLEYAPMVDVCKLPDGNGGFQYPTIKIENSDCETPAELKAWAQSVLESTCSPKVTYEIDVIQAANEGVDAQGVSLGDSVHVVDRYFGDGLRLSGRIVSMTVDELNEREISVTIGYAEEKLANKVSNGTKAYNVVSNLQRSLTTSEYIQRLVDRINAEINATGGYTYITEGQGLKAYDTAVTDPLVGTEASKAVEIKGGSIRIADSKTAQGAWEWKTVFTSGHVSADLVTAANLTAGYIGSAQSGNYWDLDTGELQVKSTTTVGGKTVATIASEAVAAQTQQSIFNKLTNNGQTQGIYLSNGLVYINGTYIQSGEIDASLIKAGSLQVVDNSGNIIFSADIDSKQASIAGFTAKNGALYNGLSSVVSTGGAGVFVGTTGVASSDGTHTAAIVSGGLVGLHNGNEVGRIVANGMTNSGNYMPISSVVMEFRLSTSATSLDGNYSWSTTPPTWVSGTKVWTRTKTVGTDNKVSYSEPKVVNIGNMSAVLYIKPQYYLSNSSTAQTGSSWSDSPPTWVSGKYIWTRYYAQLESYYIGSNVELAVAFNSSDQSTIHGMQIASEIVDIHTPRLTVSTHSDNEYASLETITNGINIGQPSITVKSGSNGDTIHLRPANRNLSFTNGMITGLGTTSYTANYYVPSQAYVDAQLDDKADLNDLPGFVLQGTTLYIYSDANAASA